MTSKNFHRTITVDSPGNEVMKKISQVNLWWAKDFSGKAEKLNDEFTVRFGDTFVDFKIDELVPNKKVSWKVTECYLPWLDDKKEWNNTEVVFEISPFGESTKIDFTHVGLVPELECYDNCNKGWTKYITVSLPDFINKGEGVPQ